MEHCRSALAIARHLEDHPKVAAVNYPGLPSHRQHALAAAQMHRGFGGLLSFEVAGGFDAGRRLIQALRLPVNAGSLGGVDSPVIQPAATWGGRLPPEEVARQGVGDGLIRMAVGIEETDDLLADLNQALAAV